MGWFLLDTFARPCQCIYLGKPLAGLCISELPRQFTSLLSQNDYNLSKQKLTYVGFQRADRLYTWCCGICGPLADLREYDDYGDMTNFDCQMWQVSHPAQAGFAAAAAPLRENVTASAEKSGRRIDGCRGFRLRSTDRTCLSK
jgi:hypothetical protein